jgi:hypothetical protein
MLSLDSHYLEGEDASETPRVSSTISMIKPSYHYIVLILIEISLVALSSPTMAGSEAHSLQVPDEVQQQARYLLDTASNPDAAMIDTKPLEHLLAFMTSSKPANSRFDLKPLEGTPGVYYEIDIHRSLADIIGYAYNPRIPTVVLRPSSVRYAQWLLEEGQPHPCERLMTLRNDSAPELVVKSAEHIVNTPDLFSGAYFAFDVDSLLMLTHHANQRILISISRQGRPSGVGKKGFILGPDDNWNYLYSDENGINRTGLGWVRSHIYEAWSVMVYVEGKADQQRVRLGIFKWLRAGWAGINMVNPGHIQRGLVRFADTFLEILESSRLPSVSALQADLNKIESIPEALKRTYIKSYLIEIKKNFSDDKVFRNRDIAEQFDPETYPEQLSTDELRAFMVREYLKGVLGKPSPVGDLLRMAMGTQTKIQTASLTASP